MVVEINPLIIEDNAQILDAVRADSSLDYQERIPEADVAGIQSTIAALMDPSNRRWTNEFIDTLVNRIGLVVARNNSWTNPLAPFKRGMLEYGSTIEEIQVGLLQAHTYDPDREYLEAALFGTEKPEVQTNFHTVNRQDYYRVSVRDTLLRRAFVTAGGLSQFINQIMEAPTTSDQWDEFLLTTSLFKEYEANGGFHHVHVPDLAGTGNVQDTTNGEDAKFALRRMRAMAKTLTFLSTRYNAARMPISAKPEDLVLMVSPEFEAAVDVEALAGAFHIERAEMYGKIVTIPQEHFGIANCQAIMTTKEFFVIADSVFQTESQRNPVALMNNYFLHHQQVISASRFVPAVMFTSGADDEIIYVSDPVTGMTAITLEAVDGTVPTSGVRGQLVGLVGAAVTTPDGGQTAVTWSVSGNQSRATFVTQNGVLHVAGNEIATSVTVTATSTWINPDDPRQDPLTQTITVPITGDMANVWPLQGALAGITVAGAEVPAFAPGTFTYSLAIPTGETITDADVATESYGPVSASSTVTKVAGGYTVVVTSDPGKGAPIVYTVNVTNG